MAALMPCGVSLLYTSHFTDSTGRPGFEGLSGFSAWAAVTFLLRTRVFLIDCPIYFAQMRTNCLDLSLSINER
jgi:hypothetical protein